jgi:hypothetical protein
MNCEFCNNVFSNKQNLNSHQKKAKYCLKIQGKSNDNNKFKCSICNSVFTSSYNLKRHKKICENDSIAKKYQTDIKKFQEQSIKDKKEIEMLKNTIVDLKEQLNKVEDRYDNLSLTAVSGNFEDETTIEINEDDFLSDGDFTVEETDIEDEYKQLPPLEVGKGFTIDHRDEDGYINVTNLCKAGNKQFKAWNRLEKTRAFIRVLSSTVLISTVELIKHNSGGNGERHTWVHPQVAINIAQWISPQFDVKVSGWVYEIMMTGKVDITNTTSFKKLQEQDKQKSIKIQYLTKKYVRSQPRVQYKEKYVIYVLTTALMKKERRYILGKATNLTSRLSVYNKSDEHEVVYYQSCGDEETMGCVENMVFQYLKEYREQANRERFILPKKEEIKLFSDTINKSVEFFKK